jgi:hypothetical protein
LNTSKTSKETGGYWDAGCLRAGKPWVVIASYDVAICAVMTLPCVVFCSGGFLHTATMHQVKLLEVQRGLHKKHNEAFMGLTLRETVYR